MTILHRCSVSFYYNNSDVIAIIIIIILIIVIIIIIIIIIIIMLALCVTENDHYIYAPNFFPNIFSAVSAPIFSKLPHDVGSSAIENFPSTFRYVPLKEIGDNPIFGDFFQTPHQHFTMSFSRVRRKFTILKQQYVYQTC